MQKLVRVFFGTDMRCQHDGLALQAEEAGLDVYSLKKGCHVVFVNKALDRIKMFSPGGVLSYLRVKGKVSTESLALIPSAFSESGDIEVAYSKAVIKTLESKLGLRG